MLNQVVLVGRLTKEVEVKELESGKKIANITIACMRSWRNEQGLYDTDFIDCVLYDAVASKASEFCQKGDIIEIKGRIQMNVKTNEEGFANGREMQVIAEKVTFLSHKKEDE